MNRRDACLHLALAYPGGIEALAQRMGKRPDTLRKELTGAAGYKFGIDEEEVLVALCLAANVPRDQVLAPITAAAVNAGAMVIPLPLSAGGDENTMRCIANTAREFAEFTASIADAAADGRVTANELKRVDLEAIELVARVQACVVTMRAMHESAKPAHLRAA
jgi:hypothetical protein